MSRVVHKEIVNYSSFTSYPTECGTEYRRPGHTYVDKTYDWKKVTCKRCLKKRKVKP